MSEKHFFARLFITAISLLCFGTQAMAQDEPDYFVYDDVDSTKIVGLTEAGTGQEELTIPKTVTKIGRYAFSYNCSAIPPLESLYILGNPVFEIDEYGESALTDVKETLGFLNLGSNMSLGNIYNLLLYGYGENTGLEKIEIEGYLNSDTENVNWGGRDEFGEAIDAPINQTLTEETIVVLPAEIVRDQVFGLAQVYGRFVLRAELFTFCTEAKFYDKDDGSHWLFYVPTKLSTQDKELFFSRVKIIMPNEGVLVHNIENSSRYVELPRINENDTYLIKKRKSPESTQFQKYEMKMDTIYSKNMLVGVVEPTTIEEQADDYTNFILYHGMFYPTSRGTLGANRAYLQILTSDYEEMKNNTTSVNLSIVFEDKDEDAIQDIQISHQQSDHDAWFTIDGRQLSSRPTLPGIYVNGGKKVIIKVDK